MRPVLTQTFNLPHLRVPSVLIKIDGVIEYQVEDVSDDDLFSENVQRATMLRQTLAEPTAEDVAEERKAEDFCSDLRLLSFPKLAGLNLYKSTSGLVSHSQPEFDISNKVEDQLERPDSFDDFEIIETEYFEEEFELL